jgi:RNA 2',3'-cyclic 3'-phosphodiesterase
VVPPAAALDHLGGSLARLQARLSDQVPAPRWVGRDAQHVTLAFFGEVPETVVPALTDALGAALVVPPVHLRLASAGTFPARGAPRVLWVGVDGDVAALAALAGAAADAARSVGVPVDRRPYQPHLTVGRWSAASAPPSGRPLVSAFGRYAGPHFVTRSVVLMRSHHGTGPRYETVAAWDGTPGSAVGTHRPTSRQERSYQA